LKIRQDAFILFVIILSYFPLLHKGVYAKSAVFLQNDVFFGIDEFSKARAPSKNRFQHFKIAKKRRNTEKKRTYMQAKNVENTTFSKQKNHQNAHILTYSQHYFLTLQTAYDIISVSTLYD